MQTIRSSPFSTTFSPTYKAATSRTSKLVKSDGIALVVGMSLRAVGLRTRIFTTISAPNVFEVCDGFKVHRVNAASNSTFMVKFQSFWYRANMEFVRNYMCRLGLRFSVFSRHSDHSVTTGNRSKPDPATTFGNRDTPPQQSFEQGILVRLGILFNSHCDLSSSHLVRAVQRMRSVVAACFYYRPSQYQESQKLNKIKGELPWLVQV